MGRVTTVLYGVVCYAAFFLTLLYAIAFVGPMTVGHLLFAIAIATTIYIVLAVRFLEERDLVSMHGKVYRDYQRRVPMLCPWPRPRHGNHPASSPTPAPR